MILRMNNIFYVLFFFLSGNLFALKFAPMVGYLEPSGVKSAFNFQVENTITAPEAFKARIEYRNKKDQENKSLAKAMDLFDLHPKTGIVYPKGSNKNSKQNLKVVWKGGKIKDIEKSFVFILEQVPIDFSKKKTSGGKMQVIPRYIASLYAAPQEFKPKVKIVSKKVKNKKLLLEFKNTGRKHHLFVEPIIKIKLSGKWRKFKPVELQGIYLHSVLAKSKRIIELDLPVDLQGKAILSKNIQVSI